MYVTEYTTSKKIRRFKYTFNDNSQLDEYAGELLCKLLNINWHELKNIYGYALYSQDQKYEEQLLSKYSQYEACIQKLLSDIFPMNSHGLEFIEQIATLLYKIEEILTTEKRPYDRLCFISTYVYDYKPALFPMQKNRISFLNFICPIIEYYCPVKMYSSEYQNIITEINSASNVTILKQKLLLLMRILMKEFTTTHPSLSNMEGSHTHTICSIIEWYCSQYISTHEPAWYMYNMDILLDNEKSMLIDQQAVNELNIKTDLEVLDHLCKKAPLYKPILFDEIYKANNDQKNSLPNNTSYLKNIIDLICHAVLYCYNKNTAPIIRCKYCKKYFPRLQNRQETCSNCKELTHPMKNEELKEVFGVNLFELINNIYRRLTYQGSDYKYSVDKYVNSLGSAQQSTLLVEGLKKLTNELNNNVYAICETYKSIPNDIEKEDYAKYVARWAKKINKYYSSALIEKLIKKAFIKNSLRPIFTIRKIQLDSIYILRSDYEIKLYEEHENA